MQYYRLAALFVLCSVLFSASAYAEATYTITETELTALETSLTQAKTELTLSKEELTKAKNELMELRKELTALSESSKKLDAELSKYERRAALAPWLVGAVFVGAFILGGLSS